MNGTLDLVIPVVSNAFGGADFNHLQFIPLVKEAFLP